MTEFAARSGLPFAVARNATFHTCNIRESRHNIQRGDIAVAFRTGDLSFQVRTMAPVSACPHIVDPLPGYLRAPFGQLRKLLDSGFFPGDSQMASHALRRCREGHQFAWLRIHVAIPALQAARKMCLVAVRHGLYSAL